MSKFINKIIIILCIIYAVIVLFTIRESYFNSDTVNDLTSSTSSFFTLIVVLLLYDRFDYRRIIFEKKMDVVLKLLEYLKSTNIHFHYNSISNKSYASGSVQLSKKEIEFAIFSEQVFNPNAYVLFHYDELNFYFTEIRKYRTNLYMPKEIIESLDFLAVNRLESVGDNNLLYNNGNIKLTINRKPENISELKNWYRTGQGDVTAKTFFTDYITLFITIENWIDNHSNIKSELNF